MNPPGPLLFRFLLLWRNAASRAFRGRRGIVLLLLCALPAALSWIFATYEPKVDDALFLGLTLMFTFQIVVPLIGLFVGVAVLGDEIEGRTLTYLFTRPQPRQVVFLARYLGLATAFGALVFATTSVSAYLFSPHISLTANEALGTAALATFGFLVYATIFATLRAYAPRALFIGFVFGFIFEGLVSKLPGTGIARCSVWHHMALLEIRLLGNRPGAPRDLAELLEGIAPDETATSGLVTLGVILAVSLALGIWRVRSQEIRLANVAT